MNLSRKGRGPRRAALALGFVVLALALAAPALSELQETAKPEIGSRSAAAAKPPSPEDAPRELQPLAARGAQILTRAEFRTGEPRRLTESIESAFHCNRVACECKGVRDCLDLIDAGLCKNFYCTLGPVCVCDVKALAP